jgi:hypothetical protein
MKSFRKELGFELPARRGFVDINQEREGSGFGVQEE